MTNPKFPAALNHQAFCNRILNVFDNDAELIGGRVEKAVSERVGLKIAAADGWTEGHEIPDCLANWFYVIGECQWLKRKDAHAPLHGGIVLAEARQFRQSRENQPDGPVSLLHHPFERVFHLLGHGVTFDLVAVLRLVDVKNANSAFSHQTTDDWPNLAVLDFAVAVIAKLAGNLIAEGSQCEWRGGNDRK
jgi:hypothetical protein